VHDLLLSVSPQPGRAAVAAGDPGELARMGSDDERTQLRFAHAPADPGGAPWWRPGTQVRAVRVGVRVVVLWRPVGEAPAPPAG
jgi:hypothetical protein